MYKPIDYSEKYPNNRYFRINRTQPFILTFFQTVIAFRRLCKAMRIRTTVRRIGKILAVYHKEDFSTTFLLRTRGSYSFGKLL